MRPDRHRVTVKVNEDDLQLLESLGLPKGILGRDVLESGWLAVYRHPRKKRLGVLVHTKTKPAKRRTFKVGKGKQRLVITQVARIGSKEAIALMARRKRKKAVEEDELEELEGLEDLDDLDDEDVEDEEPEDEDEDDEDDEEPAPKRSRKTTSKKAPVKKTKTSSRKRKPVEEDEEDEDEDEDEEPAPKRKTKSKSAKAPAKKSSAKKSSGGGLPTTRELPKGKVGPQEIADMAGGDCDARYVRIWLRESDYEREDGSRWAFSKTEARTIAKEVKATRRAAGV